MFRTPPNKTLYLKRGIIPIVLAIMVSMGGIARSDVNHSDASPSEEATALENTMCPVLTDEAVDREIFVDYQGKRVYLCCNMCRKKFIENPDLYLTNLPQFSDSSSDLEAPKETKVEEDHHGEITGEEDHDATTGEEDHDSMTAEEGHHGETTGEDHHGAMTAEESPQVTEKEHSHSDHGETSEDGRLIRFAGKFHPLVVHFPIGLILAAALAEGLFILLGVGLFKQAARFCIILGALGAVSAAALGWAAGLSAHYPGEMAQLLEFHRWLGLSTALSALVTAVFSELFHLKNCVSYRRIYLIVLILSVALVGITGHFGALLIYGPDYFTW